MFRSKLKFQIPRFEKRVLQKLGFCDELVWMVALTVEIKVTVCFQISLGSLQSINQSINQFIYRRNTKELLSARKNAYVCMNVKKYIKLYNIWKNIKLN